MRSYRCRLQVVPALLCALALLVARPADAVADDSDTHGGSGLGLSAQVV